MKEIEAPALPAPPSLMAALKGGFDATASRVTLIAFPLVLDLLIWLGPHLQIRQIVESFSRQFSSLAATNSPQTAEALQANQELWTIIGERLNLMVLLRTYPVGIPSLMASRLPLETPFAIKTINWDLSTITGALGVWLFLNFVGLVVASLYFVKVAHTVVPGKGSQPFLGEWLWAAAQVILLTLVWGILLLGVSIPASCMISALTFTNPSLGRFALLLFGGGLIWMIFPLLLSPHGIFVNRNNALVSLKKGVRVTRMTLPTTGLFFLAALVLTQGLDILWKVPPETSWFTLVGVLGHAFITTGLLASSFIYYKEADQWTQKMLSYWAQAPKARA